MNRDTKIIVGISGAGKTTELIKRSAESGIYILVANRARAEMLVKQVENMKLYIPFPVTLQEWLRSNNRFHGSSIRCDGLLIDDIDDIIKELFLPIEIKAVTMRTPSAITNLDHHTADVVEVVRCKDCIKRNTPECAMRYECSRCGGQWSWESDYSYCSYGEKRDA